jgi:deoxyribose-phosphate aldolase
LNREEVASRIDHAVLKPEATVDDVEAACRLAVEYKIASVIVKPSFVEQAKEFLKGSGVMVGTVVGFPHGSQTTRVKVAEAKELLELGVPELDMVMNIGKLLSGDLDYVREDIQQVAEAAHATGAVLKVIIESNLLNRQMIVTACKLVEEAGADYVKTSTGFNGGGATLEAVKLMKASVSSKVKVKAAGGIRSFRQAVEYIQAGCSRLGTSGTKAILSTDQGEEGSSDY